MDNLKSFVRLDFMTVKPYFTGKNVLIFVAAALFMTVTSGSISSGVFFGMMIGTLFISYPFAVGEKSNIDTLYVILSVNRKTIVLGRYVFAFLLNVCAILFVFIIAMVALPLARAFGIGSDGASEVFMMGVLLAALFAVVQAIQLPIYFKYSYTKAKFISFAPFAAMMAVFVMLTTMSSSSEAINLVSGSIASLNNGGLIVCAVLALALAMSVSYTLSLSFYKNASSKCLGEKLAIFQSLTNEERRGIITIRL